MATDQRPSDLDAVHTALRGLLAEMIGPIAVGGDAEAAAELAEMLSAVFGLDLAADTIMRSPAPDALARCIETAWYEGGGSVEELADRLSALADEG
jgi:hypothetical protein